jgi:hypothetical protein
MNALTSNLFGKRGRQKQVRRSVAILPSADMNLDDPHPTQFGQKGVYSSQAPKKEQIKPYNTSDKNIFT